MFDRCIITDPAVTNALNTNSGVLMTGITYMLSMVSKIVRIKSDIFLTSFILVVHSSCSKVTMLGTNIDIYLVNIISLRL